MSLSDPDPRFAAVRKKMTEAGLPEIAIRTFRHYFGQLLDGRSGLLGEDRIGPVETVRSASDLVGRELAGRQALGQTVIIKLNGGLGTSMGLDRAKSLLPARADTSFLELITRQVLDLRQSAGDGVPLLLMNSFATDSDSLALLDQWPELGHGQAPVPRSFLQHRVPRLAVDTHQPIAWPQAPQREWCPPGHGDLYTVLQTSGLLEQLLDLGYRYAFVSNADNLGATLDLDILGLIAEEQIPFLMEVTGRTGADRKGGHLAQDRRGRLVLRESAQCPPEERERFQDIERYRYFNTNNLWLDFKALARELEARDGVLGLPMIRNLKHVVPEDPTTPAVIQVETAMGSAIEVFEGAQILDVPRSRFVPVKTTTDLLVLWSDRCSLDDAGRVVPVAAGALDLQLDARYFGTVSDFRARFPHGAPSLLGAESLRVHGDILFEGGIVVRGRVNLVNEGTGQRRIPAGSVLADLDETS
ncbi:MAG: UTP--glucose-1-phosphate uridylyltransferase [Wenzhouxiangella sp.]|nr:MAG: UTP--glucose-1-phosphate uridylyltransferase [Wenzhouxiangella sp.]